MLQYVCCGKKHVCSFIVGAFLILMWEVGSGVYGIRKKMNQMEVKT